MEFIDSHAHINAQEFNQNWAEIITTAVESGVTSIINNAGDLASAEWGIEQAQNSPYLYATAGIHPELFLESDAEVDELDYNNLRRLITSSSKVVAIGEIGLDYTLDEHRAPILKQKELLIKQLEIALEFNLPVTLHVRDVPGQLKCFSDMFAILKEFTTLQIESKQPLTGVFHCWTGTPDQLAQALELGFYVSFSGIVTYKSAGHIVDAARLAPIDKILIETDSPYLTPEPARSSDRPSVNQPKYVIMTAEKLASIKGVTLQEIAKSTTQNTRRLFKLP